MKGAGGSIINMSSLCGVRAQAELAAYDAAKAAVTHLTKSIALHCAAQRYGIRCNSIHPGTIDTPIVQGIGAGRESRSGSRRLDRGPPARAARPARGSRRDGALPRFGRVRLHHGAEFRVDGGASI